jgi:hypothetical protein
MGVGRTRAVGKGILLAFVCLIVAPILGVWAGGSMPNPPGNGPGTWQVVVGVAVPALIASVAALVARVGHVKAAWWAIASLALTGGLVILLIWLVHTYIPT